MVTCLCSFSSLQTYGVVKDTPWLAKEKFCKRSWHHRCCHQSSSHHCSCWRTDLTSAPKNSSVSPMPPLRLLPVEPLHMVYASPEWIYKSQFRGKCNTVNIDTGQINGNHHIPSQHETPRRVKLHVSYIAQVSKKGQLRTERVH